MQRYFILEEDRNRILEILQSSGYFYPYEVDIGIEVVDEYLKKGEKSGYVITSYSIHYTKLYD